MIGIVILINTNRRILYVADALATTASISDDTNNIAKVGIIGNKVAQRPNALAVNPVNYFHCPKDKDNCSGVV